MPFQDVEDEPVEVRKPPGTIERVLRKIFVEDFGLKLLALAITLLVWMAVTGENQPITIHTAVQLNFVRPDNLAISNDPPRTVEVLLTGSRNRLNNLRLLDLVATVDLSDSKPGDRVIRLSPERVAIQLPSGVTISSFQPTTLPIRLEPIVRREVAVEVHLDGEPAAGFELYGTQSTPAAVWIEGPASHVKELQNAPTETISVDGRNETFTAPRVSIAISDEKLDIAESLVDVVVTIGEKRIEKSFENVPLPYHKNSSQAQTATVVLFGPPQLLQQLKVENITLVADTGSAGKGMPKLQLPPTMQDQITLVSITPSFPKS
jgi:YbbR domain-containing protein